MSAIALSHTFHQFDELCGGEGIYHQVEVSQPEIARQWGSGCA
jgi:hypothetical protein